MGLGSRVEGLGFADSFLNPRHKLLLLCRHEAGRASSSNGGFGTMRAEGFGIKASGFRSFED